MDYKLITLDSILAEIMMRIPEDDRMYVSNLKMFLKSVCDGYVSRMVPKSWMEHMVTVVHIDNKEGKLPDGFNSVVMVCGSTDQKLRHMHWRKEIQGWMKKATEGCTYTVFKNCDKCDKDDCDHPVVLASKHLQHELASGTEYWLTRHVRGYSENEKKEKCSPYDRRFFLMRPNRAPFFNMKDSHINECLNLRLYDSLGTDYEYEIYNGKIKTNFKEGLVLLSYLGKSKDKDGTVMIPQIESFISAVTAYALKEMYTHMYRIFKDNTYRNLFVVHKEEWVDAHNIAERDLYHVPYDELTMALGTFMRRGHVNNNFLSSSAHNYPDWLKIYDDHLFTGLS
jgi:hypothetical protein